MLSRRIIPCLDVKDGLVVKGVQFRNHQVMGSIVELARSYRDQGADELVFYDISASAQGRKVEVSWVSQLAQILDIPFCVAGGIRNLEIAREILNRGADKISVNSPALENPQLISDLAAEFGRQCVVVSVDSRGDLEGEYFVYLYTGEETKSIKSARSTWDWLSEVQMRGAGEVVLNCMDADGTAMGYDLVQLARARKILKIPLVASGGAGTVEHFLNAFLEADVDAALAAGVFHRGELTISNLKTRLRQSGIEVRL